MALLRALLALLMLLPGVQRAPSSPASTTGPAAHGTVLYRLDPDGQHPLRHVDRYPSDTDGGARPVAVTSPDRRGRRALRFSVPGGGTRSEVVPRVRDLRPGDDLWFDYEGYLPRDFPVGARSWQLIEQWHSSIQNGSSPTVSIEVQQGHFVLDGGYGAPRGSKPYHVPFAAAVAGRPVHLLVHIVFSHQRSRGRVDVVLDGRRVLSDYHPPAGTLYTPHSTAYLKVGMYRDPDLHTRATVFVDDVRVATTAAAARG